MKWRERRGPAARGEGESGFQASRFNAAPFFAIA
jgi:hypothetical protein